MLYDPTLLPPCGPICDPCLHDLHESCRGTGCKGCGCFKSATAMAAAGPKLPNPVDYKGAP